jgi:non-specific serine/threonine protein kinase
VLTGTPVENNTSELWSQFSFLNPGLLGSLSSFRSCFAMPIEKKHDEEAITLLKRLIFPFVLRRSKELVEKELPEKSEQIYYCNMNPDQAKLYRHWRDYYRSVILQKIDEAGLDRARMNILEGLVKLRQISCHPRLIDKDSTAESAKFEALKEMLEDILAEGHKVLIFSQFVRMLTVVRNHLDEQYIPYEYLDGHTIDRKTCVQHFQTDENVRIFLISLKAGGTGLNLTAADYVILYDPWWNPAVEMQATDRAHRIGQDKKVFVYRMITKDTVEEKMLELQERKRSLVANLISVDGGFFKSMTRKDIEVLFS